jgi:putative endonuclease
MAWMYILECADGSYYVGSTTDLERRVWEHNEGLGAKYTARRRPVKLVYAAEFATIAEAYEREKQVQGWGRAKREALIRGDYAALPELARKDFDRGSLRLGSAQATDSTQRLNPRDFQIYHAKRKGLPDDNQRQ